MQFDPAHSALLIIDNQIGFLHPTHWGPEHSNPNYEANVVSLMRAFRSLEPKLLSIHIQHISSDDWPDSPLHPSNGNGTAFQQNSTPSPGELIIQRNVNPGFIGTDLEEVLNKHRIWKLFICGLSTDHCVSTTTRMAGNLHVTDHVDEQMQRVKGEVVLVEDATAAWKKPGGKWDAETIHAVHVERLREFASIVGTDDVL